MSLSAPAELLVKICKHSDHLHHQHVDICYHS